MRMGGMKGREGQDRIIMFMYALYGVREVLCCLYVLYVPVRACGIRTVKKWCVMNWCLMLSQDGEVPTSK